MNIEIKESWWNIMFLFIIYCIFVIVTIIFYTKMENSQKKKRDELICARDLIMETDENDLEIKIHNNTCHIKIDD